GRRREHDRAAASRIRPPVRPSLTPVKDAWRKNAPEIAGLWNGAVPDFVLAAKPADLLPGVPVFCYHLVEAEALEADLAFLAANGYRTISSKELVDHLDGVRDAPERSVVL